MTIDRDTQSAQDLLSRSKPSALVDLESLAEAFAPLLEWEYWTRDQKRSVLATIIPNIRVADYQVTALGLHPSIFSKENTRRGRYGELNAKPPRIPLTANAATIRKTPSETVVTASDAVRPRTIVPIRSAPARYSAVLRSTGDLMMGYVWFGLFTWSEYIGNSQLLKYRDFTNN